MATGELNIQPLARPAADASQIAARCELPRNPKGFNMNSRGRQPTVDRQKLAPALKGPNHSTNRICRHPAVQHNSTHSGSAPNLNVPPWAVAHGYSRSSPPGLWARLPIRRDKSPRCAWVAASLSMNQASGTDTSPVCFATARARRPCHYRLQPIPFGKWHDRLGFL